MATRTTPCITLWQPWASWIALGWKSIETRTHQRFGSLMNKRIGIHAGLKWDNEALGAAADFLTLEQQHMTEEFRGVHGKIVCTARVMGHILCENALHEKLALIECGTTRYGLILDDVRMLNIPAKGEMGIWYFDIDDELSGVPQCRKCGCTENYACTGGPFEEPCHWHEPDLCSWCAGKR